MNKIPLFLDGHFLGFVFKNHNGTYSMNIDGTNDTSLFNNVNELNKYMKDYGIVGKMNDTPDSKEYSSFTENDLTPTNNIDKGLNTFTISNPKRTFPQPANNYIDAEKQILNDPLFQIKDSKGNIDRKATIKKAQQWMNKSNFNSTKGSLKEDGIVGPRTMEAFNSYAKDSLLNSQVGDQIPFNKPNIIKPDDIVQIEQPENNPVKTDVVNTNPYQHYGPPLSSAAEEVVPKNIDIMKDIVGYTPNFQVAEPNSSVPVNNDDLPSDQVTPVDEKIIKPSDIIQLEHENNMGNAWLKTNNRFVPVTDNNSLVQIRTRSQNTAPLNKTDHVVFGNNIFKRDIPVNGNNIVNGQPSEQKNNLLNRVNNFKLFPKLQDKIKNYFDDRKEAKQEVYDQLMEDGSGLTKGEYLEQLRENNNELPLARYKKRKNLQLERKIGRQSLKELKDEGKINRIIDDNETGENIIRTRSAAKNWLEPYRQDYLTNSNTQENDLKEENSALRIGNKTFKRFENLEDKENYFNDRINSFRERMNNKQSSFRNNFISRLKNRRSDEDYPIEYLEPEYTQPDKKQLGGNMSSIGNRGYYTDIGDYQMPETYIPDLTESKLKERFYNGLNNSKPSNSLITKNLGNGNDPNFSIKFNELVGDQPSSQDNKTTINPQDIIQSSNTNYDPTRLMYYGNKMQHMANMLPTMYNTSKYLFDKPEIEKPRYNNQESAYLGGLKNIGITPNMEPINTTQRSVFDTIRNNSRNVGQLMSNLQTAATNTTRAANEEAYKAKLANIQFKQQYLQALNNVGDQHRLIDEQNYLRNQQHRLAKENLATAAIDSGEKTLINKAQMHNQEQSDWMKAQMYLNEIAEDYKVVPDVNGTYQIVFKPKGQNNYQTINFSDLGQFNNTLKAELYGKEEKPVPNSTPSGTPSSYSVTPSANTTKVKKYGGIIIKRNSLI